MSNQPKKILKTVFGYDEFRPLQQEIIENVLRREDTLVIMPTGGGKSLCYQIPALIFQGLTVVVSPLISLMQDQVNQLTELGIEAVVLNSTLTYQEYQTNVSRILNNEVSLLYVAPETLLMNRTLTMLSSCQLDCLTIDEAHCISEWGHDFRPEYRQLMEVRQRFPDAVCMALTATATPRVQKDIMKCLHFKESNEFIASFDRKNLFLQIAPKRNAVGQTMKFLEKFPDQSGIIYCLSRRQVDELAEFLDDNDFSVRPYHAGLPDMERHQNQEAFIRDDVQIMVATIAFGMGINKPNIRFILHYDLPKNIESYYQQIGRAGRDGLRSHCLLLFGYGDIRKIRYFIDQMEGQEQRVAQIHLNALIGFAESGDCRRIPLLKYFGEEYSKSDCEMCDNCLAEDKEKVDMTIPAQKFLSCIKRTGEIFGAGHIIDVLRGSEAKKVLNRKHDQLSTYGIGKEYSKKQWYHLSRQFLQKGLLEQDLKYGSLKLTDKAWEVLHGEAQVFATVIEPEQKYTQTDIEKTYDRKLFEVLRKKRKNLADDANIPPYVIFPDKTLMEMATFFPQSHESLLQIHGVGQVKAKKYGQTFLDLICDFCREHNIKEKPKQRTISASSYPTSTTKPRHMVVGEAFNVGKSVKELKTEYGVKLSTILKHLHKYAVAGNSLRATDEFLEFSHLSTEEQARVQKTFEQLGTDRLRPVFDALDEQVSYDELHVLRLYYLSQVSVE